VAQIAALLWRYGRPRQGFRDPVSLSAERLEHNHDVATASSGFGGTRRAEHPIFTFSPQPVNLQGHVLCSSSSGRSDTKSRVSPTRSRAQA
jgi:hypothetical protein